MASGLSVVLDGYGLVLQAFVFFSSTGKAVRPKNVTSTSKNRAAQKFGHSSRKGKLRPAAVTLANYFRVKAKADHIHANSPSPSHKPDGEGSGNQSPPGSDPMAPKNRKTATSLILFEEVNHLKGPTLQDVSFRYETTHTHKLGLV